MKDYTGDFIQQFSLYTASLEFMYYIKHNLTKAKY